MNVGCRSLIPDDDDEEETERESKIQTIGLVRLGVVVTFLG